MLISNNFLQLNNDKTEVILFGPSKTRNYVAGNLENLNPYVKYHVKNLGIIFDSEVCLEKQISSVVKNSYYQLRIISRLKSLLYFQDLEIVIHAFITSHLDYCNSLYVGLQQSSFSQLLMVQNVAARLLTGTKKNVIIVHQYYHTFIGFVFFRIQFKILLLVFKAHCFHTPHLIFLILLICIQRLKSFMSANKALLHVPQSRLKLKGERAFAVAAPRLWNQLPPDIRSAFSLFIFKSRLKTYFYSLTFLGY